MLGLYAPSWFWSRQVREQSSWLFFGEAYTEKLGFAVDTVSTKLCVTLPEARLYSIGTRSGML